MIGIRDNILEQSLQKVKFTCIIVMEEVKEVISMLKQLFKWFFAARNHDRSESEAKIAALEKKLAELEALVKAQNQKSEEPAAKRDMLPQKPSVQKSAPTVAQKNTPPKQADCFDMIEYFCNGHDDTAVDVILYDQSGNKISRETFSWSSGCGEVTSEGIWRKAGGSPRALVPKGLVGSAFSTKATSRVG